MAKITHDREDLLRDGTAMPVRGRLRFDGREVVVGWRRDDSCSWFCNLDPVFQFNARGQLRRVFASGNRLACEGGRLCQLFRDASSGDRVELRRVPLEGAESDEIMKAWSHWRVRVERQLLSQDARVDAVGVSPVEFRERLQGWLAGLPDPPKLAESPGV